MGMKKQSSVERVVRKRGVHPRSVCIKFSISYEIQVKKSKSTKLPLGIRLLREKKKLSFRPFM